MNQALERLGTWAARRHWWVIGAWLVILVGLSLGRVVAGGDFVNDYSVPGSESSEGLDVLRADFPSASGYGGQIVFKAGTGTVADQSAAVGTAMKNLGGLPHVISATDPLDRAEHAGGGQGRHDRLRQRVLGRRAGLARLDVPGLDGQGRAAGPGRRPDRRVRRRRRADRPGSPTTVPRRSSA